MSKSISQLDAITNEAIDLSQFLAIDDPAQTFKLSLLQLRDFFTGQLYPVGSTLFRLDNRTPTECGFPGTWSKIAADVALHTAAADGSNVGTSTGSNAPAVPVPQHTHTASSASAGDHGHTASTASAGDHGHTASTASAGNHNHIQAENFQRNYKYGLSGEDLGTNEIYDNGKGGDPSLPYTSTTGAHTHGVTVNNGGAHTHGVTVTNAGAHSHTVTVDNTGTAGVTLDVRGARILGHLWQRTA